MGPGCFFPGNASFHPAPRRRPGLQWGRDVSIPEIRPPAARPAITSMASMGPGCFYPGNSATAAATYGMWALQWGRGVSIPEIPTNKASSTQAAALQWGRDVSIPEIATSCSILFSRTYAPVRERLSILSPISTPGPSATPLTPAAPQLYRSASAPRSTSPDPPLAPDYRVVNTGCRGPRSRGRPAPRRDPG